MAGSRAKGLHRNLEMVFGGASCAGLSDGQLLDRFLARCDDTGELAFEALVTRHGPMVCKSVGTSSATPMKRTTPFKRCS
ncbi:MAG: RNA polymerase sigma factor [Isosphaeraceae bacterium]